MDQKQIRLHPAACILMGLVSTELLGAQAGQGQILTAPVRVNLHWRTISSVAQKLGIYAAINGGDPQIFEFDTGGSGFNATIACDFTTSSSSTLEPRQRFIRDLPLRSLPHQRTLSPGPFPLALTQSCASNKTYVADTAHVK